MFWDVWKKYRDVYSRKKNLSKEKKLHSVLHSVVILDTETRKNGISPIDYLNLTQKVALHTFCL